ncbi:tRNA pseudouridine(55) synthase TruB [Nitrosospira multiformis]|uniref:tRNA pseudouridine(55) synthase TruB n=1 Tax=Nitrosospira multiformis TaxID=1231 RepID=UPI000895F11C|nr:tRNA pseudouridine(55) synthase TruB [Nitrosospira multiformis]SDZ97770.1 tRNA pseudouridine synthase B [Nitrosospira multiformis]
MSPGSKRHISGVLLLDKASGLSSNQALQTAKRIFSAHKAGHTGTLDPMATGLLPICFGEATKFSSALLGADKTYEAVLRLGYMSTTGDAEGEISIAAGMESQYVDLTWEKIEAIRKSFIGVITQVPPMYSAIKHRGKPMYTFARAGVEIERQPRAITIHDLSIEAYQGNEMRIRVTCGSGTYVRTLAEDLGHALGCGGAYLTALRRSALGGFDLPQAYTLTGLEAMPPSQRDSCLLPADSLLRSLPPVVVDSAAALSLLQGRAIPCTHPAGESLLPGRQVRLYDKAQRFLGLGEISTEGYISPKRLIRFEQSL